MKIVVKFYFGSYFYGIFILEFDVDFKEIFVFFVCDIFIGNVKEYMSKNINNILFKNIKDDIDYELYSFKYFFKLVVDGEIVVLDMFYILFELVVKFDLFDVWKFI